MVVRLKITIEQDEYSGLLKLALSEMRNPESQLRFILRQELEKMGLLLKKNDQNADTKNLSKVYSSKEK